MKFTAAGDVLIQQQIPFEPKDFQKIKEFIEKGDGRFFNLETTLNYEGECCSNQTSGGTYVRTNPESLYDFLKYGFNVTTFNNNHIMDFSYDGLLKTIEYANKAGIKHCGVGRNLGEASAPCYLDTPNGRVAYISFCVTTYIANMAGEQTRRVKGRPGMNILRRSEKLIVPEEDFNAVVRIAKKSGVNAQNDTIRKEGYLPPLKEGTCELGEMALFEKGDCYKYVLTPNKDDLARAEREIHEAKLGADYVIVSLHCHDQISEDKSDVPEFLEEVSRFFIDKGANAVIGHGPHLSVRSRYIRTARFSTVSATSCCSFTALSLLPTSSITKTVLHPTTRFTIFSKSAPQTSHVASWRIRLCERRSSPTGKQTNRAS